MFKNDVLWNWLAVRVYIMDKIWVYEKTDLKDGYFQVLVLVRVKRFISSRKNMKTELVSGSCRRYDTHAITL